ncbi:MAG: hypothetical protein ACLP8S_19880 [Solirubrobacteraceae bacterium]
MSPSTSETVAGGRRYDARALSAGNRAGWRRGRSARETAVFAGGYEAFSEWPGTLLLWAVGGLIDLHWNGWGNAVARASGRESMNSGGGVFVFPRAQVQLSDIQMCGGRRVYTGVKYRLDRQQWITGVRNGCRLAG